VSRCHAETSSVSLQAMAAAEQAAQEAASAADISQQELSSRLQDQAAENAKLKDQLKKLNADLLDLRGQLDVQATQQAMLEAREQQHQQQLQEQGTKLKDKAAELDAMTKELQVRAGEQGLMVAVRSVWCAPFHCCCARPLHHPSC